MKEKTFNELAQEVAELVGVKQLAYGDSFGKAGRILKELYPNGISIEQMDDALTLTRIIDKMFRIATKKDALGESPWRDIMGYALLSVKRDEKEREALADHMTDHDRVKAMIDERRPKKPNKKKGGYYGI